MRMPPVKSMRLALWHRAALLLFSFVAFIAVPRAAVAQTTGALSGTVTDQQTKAPIAGVRVSAASPSGKYTAVTDVRGFYSLTGVYADTYTLSFELQGYQLAAVQGVNVFAGQAQTLDQSLTRQLRTIAVVHSANNNGDFHPTQTSNTYTVTSSQITNLLGGQFNTNEDQLITSLPGVATDANGYVSIHGGQIQEAGFEFEGIPYTDAFENYFGNGLVLPGYGVASAQLTPGAGNASVASNGTGQFNVVAKRGTYPAYANVAFDLGGPGYSHSLNGEISWANPDGSLSNYASFTGYNEAFRYGNGSEPAAAILATGTTSGTLINPFRSTLSREFLDNFVWRFGKHRNQALQLFYDNGQVTDYYGYGGLNGLYFQSNNPYFLQEFGPAFGLSNAQLQAISPLYGGQSSATESLISSGRAPAAYYLPHTGMKAEYRLNVGSTSVISAQLYQTRSLTLNDAPNGGASAYGIGDMFDQYGGVATGGSLSLQSQVNDKNLIDAGVSLANLVPVNSTQSLGTSFEDLYYYGTGSFSPSGPFDAGFGTPYAFISPKDTTCPLVSCGYAYVANPGATQLTVPLAAGSSPLTRTDWSAYLNDKITLNPQATLELGLRDDVANYHYPAPQLNPTTCTAMYLPSQLMPVPNPAYSTTGPHPTFTNSSTSFGGVCPYLESFNIPSNERAPSVLQPRVGFTYRLGSDSSLRLTWGRSVFFPSIGQVSGGIIDPSVGAAYRGISPENTYYGAAYGAANYTGPLNSGAPCGVAGFYVPCLNFGEQLFWLYQNAAGVPYQPARPETSNNYQATFEHQFTKGFLNGVSLSVAPWYRRQYDTLAIYSTPLLSNGLPVVVNGAVVTGPPVVTNLGKEFGDGVDLDIRRENQYGLSGEFTASYINEFSSVLPSSYQDYYPLTPATSILAGDIYRVSFLPPLQMNLGLTYRTKSGWSLNPRLRYDIGYPLGGGRLTAADVNGVPQNVPNTNVVQIGAAQTGGLPPAYYADPMYPGSILKPNIAAFSGYAESSAPGGLLSPQDVTAAVTLQYAPPHSALSYGIDIENLFNELYSGTFFNPRYQPVATGISGPLTGKSVVPADFGSNGVPTPYALPVYGSILGGPNIFLNAPNAIGRTITIFVNARL